MDELIGQLEALGYTVDQSFRSQGFVVIRDFVINAGRDAGRTVDIGILGRDFPFTPPAGIHIRPILDPPAERGDQGSPLGNEWCYWSRRIPEWDKNRSAHNIISYINKVFLNA